MVLNFCGVSYRKLWEVYMSRMCFIESLKFDERGVEHIWRNFQILVSQIMQKYPLLLGILGSLKYCIFRTLRTNVCKGCNYTNCPILNNVFNKL